jgi:hypothetical protein
MGARPLKRPTLGGLEQHGGSGQIGVSGNRLARLPASGRDPRPLCQGRGHHGRIPLRLGPLAQPLDRVGQALVTVCHGRHTGGEQSADHHLRPPSTLGVFHQVIDGD